MKKIIIAVLVILLVSMFSGCMGQKAAGPRDVGKGYPGLEFIEFYPVNKKVPQGSAVTLYYSIQNNGYFNAENVNIKLYNCGDINKGSHTWMKEGLIYNCNEAVISPPNGVLRKPDRVQGITGEVSEAEISLETMNAHLPIGESPHAFSARLEYDYMSTATRDVVFTTFDNWKEKGGAIETGALISSSFPAPLSVSINAPSEPIIITKFQDVDQPQEFTISVQMRNTGGGFLKGKQLLSVELCYDTTLVELSREDGFKDFKPNTVNYCCQKDGGKPVISDSSCGDNQVDFTECQTHLKVSCGLSLEEGYVDVCNGLEAAPGNDGGSQTCECSGVYPAKAPDCISVFNPSQLNLIGQTNQWRDVSAIFKTKMMLDESAVVKVQDISNFGATVKYRYITDKSAKLTLVRIK